MTKRILIASALITGLLTMTVHALPRIAPVDHLTARAVESTNPARFVFRPVDIVISRWSTLDDHHVLMTALLERGPVHFLNTLCGFAPVGTFTMGGRDFPIRYAWSIEDSGGGRRIYLATDEPVSLTNPTFGPFLSRERLTFLELRVNRRGEGDGKFSEAVGLSVDESRSVIELRDYLKGAFHLVMVRSEALAEE
ncbi:MAG TPA: hypothetical protein VKB36_12065 [Vicinamibacterales bacterium]|nr:hypothetical protein [Vicinamibacterales bacterium]